MACMGREGGGGGNKIEVAALDPAKKRRLERERPLKRVSVADNVPSLIRQPLKDKLIKT